MGRDKGHSFGNLSDRDAPMSCVADKHLVTRYKIATGGRAAAVEVIYFRTIGASISIDALKGNCG